MTQEDTVAAYGRARRLASRYCFGIVQHLERIRNCGAEDNDDVAKHEANLQNKNDWEIVVIFLLRLRRCIIYLANFNEFKSACGVVLKDFDQSVPTLKKLRDYEEHFDDYSIGKGKDQSLGWGQLESYWYGSNEFSSGAGNISVEMADQTARKVWILVGDLEATAKTLGYLSWDDRYGPKGKFRSVK